MLMTVVITDGSNSHFSVYSVQFLESSTVSDNETNNICTHGKMDSNERTVETIKTLTRITE